MTFTQSRLVGNRVMVSGTDVLGTAGQTILDSTQWDEIKANQQFDTAQAAFDEAVAAHFADITKAAEQLNKSLEVPEDPASYVVLREAVEGQRPDPGHTIKLTHDSIVLRLVEQGDTSRLVWVNDELEILERGAQPSDVVLPGTVTDAVGPGPELTPPAGGYAV